MIHHTHTLQLGTMAAVEHSEFRTPGLVAIRVRYIDCKFRDVSAIQGTSDPAWAKVVVVLGGEAEVELGSRVVRLSAGDVVLSPAWDADPIRPRTSNVEALRLAFCQDRVEFPRFSAVVRGGPSLSARLSSLVDRTPELGPRGVLESIVQMMATAGVVARPVRGPIAKPVSPRMLSIANAISAKTFPLSRRPMIPDLAAHLGWSERSIVRHATSHFRQHFPGSVKNWRRYLKLWRLSLAATMLSIPGTKVEAIARDVGFGAPSALCHAFEAVGWPSATEIQADYRR